MSRLSALAEDHWRTYLPTAYASIRDKESFFRELGDEAQSQIVGLSEALRGEDPADEPFALKMGRYAMARSNAEAQVLREMLLLPAEEDPTPENDASFSGELEQALAEFRAAREEF